MRLEAAFFHRDCLEVAPDLVGKILVHRLPDGTELRERIAETEAYRLFPRPQGAFRRTCLTGG